MKAILMHAPGAPQVLSLADVPSPQIAHDTDLLVRLKAAGVNPIDTKLRARGTYFPEACRRSWVATARAWSRR